MKKRYACLALAALLASTCLLSQPAQAITFTYSDKTQRIAPYFEFRGMYDLPLNLNVSGGVGFTPDLSSFVSPLTPSSSSSSGDLLSQFNALIKWDMLFDADLNVGYNFNLVDLDLGIGRLSAILTPYVGYRHLFASSGQLNSRTLSSNVSGLNYGGHLRVGLPLGFSGYAFLGASTCLGGNFDDGGISQPLNANSLTLPRFGLGAAWHLPIVDLASIYVGYTGFFLPQDLRISSQFTHGSVLINGVSAGFNVLFFGI